jgi:hypothetical protein
MYFFLIEARSTLERNRRAGRLSMIGGAFAHVERPAKKQRNSIAITPGGRYFPLVGSGRLTF